MAFVWVQVWGPLPTIYEAFMTDTNITPQPEGDLSNSSQVPRQHVSHITTALPYDNVDRRRDYQRLSQSRTPQGNFSNMPPFPPQQNVSSGRQDAFNLNSLGSNLPEAYPNYGNSASQRYSSAHSPSALQFQPPNAQFSVPGGMTSPPGTMQYNYQYQPQYQGVYAAGQSPTSLGNTTAIGGQYYQGQSFMGAPQQPGSSFYVQPGQYGSQNQMYATRASGQYVPTGAYGVDARSAVQHRGAEYLGGQLGGMDAGRTASIGKASRDHL